MLTHVIRSSHNPVVCCRMQCVLLPGTSCPTGTVRSFRRGVPTPPSMIRRPTIRWCASPGRLAASRVRSRWSPTCTAGRTSCWWLTTTRRNSAGTSRSLSTNCSATTRTTRSTGCDSAPSRPTSNSTTFSSK